ncbi:hypothetical protein L2E82_32841 [Cichorium intybus]|uniref:Uncharacterized protein n=1 Tax=Cichorium intybus TaxID=13427 RepID=A0ACB9BH45_CICIN|nr:hypothetical protein L2E82_32841 [Cichorium intybus]
MSCRSSHLLLDFFRHHLFITHRLLGTAPCSNSGSNRSDWYVFLPEPIFALHSRSRAAALSFTDDDDMLDVSIGF